MNVLLNRPLPPGALATLQQIAPAAEFRRVVNADALADDPDWAEVVFGNPPALLLAGRSRLRWLQIVSSGFDEYSALAGRPLTVTTAHGVHAAPIAQQVLMAMLMFARGQLHFGACQQAARWDRNPAVPFRLSGQVLGVIGYGLIGRELAKFAPYFEMTMRAVRQSSTPCPPELARLDTLEGLDALLQESDHVVVTLPLTSKTHGLLDARRIALLKPGSFFYNVARGGLVDEDTLIDRLEAGSLGGAAMDVFSQEPLPASSRWWKTPRTLVFPHIAGHHRDLNADTFALFADNLARYVAGDPLRNVADFTRCY